MRVLLVHGLGRTPLSLAGLYRALRRAGHEPEFFGYWAFAEPYQRIRRRLVARLRAAASGGQPVALIGHSLGGLLLRHALAEVPDLQVHQLIMLGTPNRPPRMARAAARWLPFRALTRSCGGVLASATAYAEIPVPSVRYTLFAGTAGWRRPRGIFGDEPHDGFVSVGETRILDADEPVLLPVRHTFMMDNPRLRELVVALLA